MDAGGISAIRGKWLEELNNEVFLLETSPAVDSIQTIEIGGKFQIDLSVDFWVFYENPDSFYNGLDNEEGIKSIHFCRCSLLTIQSSSNNSAVITVKILEVVSLQELDMKFEFEKELPQPWKSFLKSSKEYVHITDYGEYSLLRINIQSDLGITMVIKRGISESRILMVNDWDFHTDAFYGTHINISNSELESYFIKK